MDVGLPDGAWLSLNIEPEALGTSAPGDVLALQRELARRVPLVLEITERDVTSRPAELLEVIDWARELGCRIALDDIGADPRVLALLPVIAPEIMKLDLRLVQQRADAAVAEIVAAVNAQAKRSGAVVVAEGIEHGDHVFAAGALGAILGQGWHFGRPGPLPEALEGSAFSGLAAPVEVRHRPLPTPFELARAHRPARVATHRRVARRPGPR